MSYDGYLALASVYDKLNEEIDYKGWADFFEACFERYGAEKPEIVLDLACGTGRMTCEMAKRGYDMIGVDGSIDMLSEAYSKDTSGILYLCQDMRELELYGTVGATLCCLDSLNYLTEDGDLERVFSLVHNYSDPDALFLFDVNSEFKFENIYADNSYILEDENDDGGAIFCGWQNSYDAKSRICSFYLSVFEEGDNGEYYRADEEQRERCYSVEEIRTALKKTGFELLDVFADTDFSSVSERSERLYFVTRVKK
jgi:SAM-dependent methyltransferase